MRSYFWLVFVPFFLVGCMPTYKAENYAHKPTHKFTQAMTNWEYEKASRIVKTYKADVIVAPRFREFSKNFSSNYAFVYFITKNKDTNIHLKSVSIRTPNRKPMIEIVDRTFQTKIRILESPIQAPKKTLDYSYSRTLIFDQEKGHDASKWNHENKLIFRVVYSVNGGPEITEDFKMEKYSYKGIAWPT